MHRRQPRSNHVAQASSFNIVEATIDDIHAGYQSGQLTCRQVVQMYLDRIEAFDKKGPNINAIITVNADALKEADRLDAAYKSSGRVGPLHGIPVIVKDQADVKGMPTTLGSLLFKDYFPDRDSFVAGEFAQGGRGDSRQSDSRRARRRRHPWFALRLDAQSLRHRAHRRRFLGRLSGGGSGEFFDGSHRPRRFGVDPQARHLELHRRHAAHAPVWSAAAASTAAGRNSSVPSVRWRAR